MDATLLARLRLRHPHPLEISRASVCQKAELCCHNCTNVIFPLEPRRARPTFQQQVNVVYTGDFEWLSRPRRTYAITLLSFPHMLFAFAYRLLTKIGRSKPCRSSQPFIWRSSPPNSKDQESSHETTKNEVHVITRVNYGIVPVIPRRNPWFVVMSMPFIRYKKLSLRTWLEKGQRPI